MREGGEDMTEVYEYTAKEVFIGDEFGGNELVVEFIKRGKAVISEGDMIIITEMLPKEDCREVHFRAENIRNVIAVLEEMADWLEESPEERL